MATNYTKQNRGSDSDYSQYLEAMDAISVEKVASASVFFAPQKGNKIVDVGMGSGTSTAILANLFPNLQIVGVDINPTMVQIASQKYQRDNLLFKVDDGELLHTFDDSSIDGFFNCSAIHHITSYNGYDSNRAIRALRRQVELLKENGVLVVRDFLKPEEKEVIVEFSTIVKKSQPSDADLFVLFSKSARSLSSPLEQGFPIEELSSADKKVRRFKVFYTDVTEFVRRKDYFDNWDVELQEEYGYFTQREFEDVLEN